MRKASPAEDEPGRDFQVEVLEGKGIVPMRRIKERQ
jgi:hypothetical protein